MRDYCKRVWDIKPRIEFRESKAKVTDLDTRYDPRFDFVVNDPDHKGDDTNFLATVLEQKQA